MPLQHQPNIPGPDGFYEELIHAQHDLSDEQADMLVAKLALILANHVGDRAVLSEAIALARSNTLAAVATAVPAQASAGATA
jgi:hypothetical protein